jgi:hypothetical protein
MSGLALGAVSGRQGSPQEFNADPVFMMARHTSGAVTDQDMFAEGRPELAAQ